MTVLEYWDALVYYLRKEGYITFLSSTKTGQAFTPAFLWPGHEELN